MAQGREILFGNESLEHHFIQSAVVFCRLWLILVGMKHKRQFFLIPLGLLTGFIFLFCVLSCDFEIPERVSVKTSGTRYEFPLGEGSFMVREKMSAGELRNTFNEGLPENSPEIKVYEYNPTQNDEDVLQYLIKYPIQEVSLALSADGTNDMNFSSKFEITNLNDRIGESLKIEENTFDVAETGTSAAIPNSEGIYFNISSPDFDEMNLSAGNFLITVNPKEAFSEGFALTARVVLCDSKGNEIASSEERDLTTGTSGLPLTIDLAGKTVFPQMSFKLAGSVSGGTPGRKNSLAVSMQAVGLKIKTVSGLTMTGEDLGDLDNDPATPDGNVSFVSDFAFDGINDYLISAEIESGNLNIFSKIPEGWSGVKVEMDKVSISQTGGLTVGEESFADGENDGTYLFNKTVLLENQKILPGAVGVSGQVSVSFENASLVFDETKDNPEIEISGSCQIEKLGNLKIDISALGDAAQTSGQVDTGLSFSTLLSDKLGDAGNLIKNVRLSGVEGYVYAVQPGFEAFNNTSYSNCNIQAVYETEGVAKNLDLVTGSLALKETNLDLDALADEDFVVTDTTIFNEKNYSVKTSNNVCDLLNDMPDNLKIRYDLSGFTNPESYIELSSGDFEKLTELKSVQIFVLFKIPVQITLDDKVDYPVAESVNDGYIKISDVKKLVESINSDGEEEENEEDEDLLKRDSQEDFEDVKKYLDLVESVSIFYKTKNSTKLEIRGTMEDSLTEIHKDLTIAPTADYPDEYKEIEITDREDLKKIFNTYPFNPIFQVSIKADGGEIPRNAEFGITGYVRICLNGEVEIWSKNKENE